MTIQIFTSEMLNGLVEEAKSNTRLRHHKNIHTSYQEPCQRLFNSIEVGSYIRPHKHSSDPRDETLVAVRGLMALVSFDDQGGVVDVVRFGSEAFGTELAVGVDLPANTWHTVVALVPGCVLLEVKAGPFDLKKPKDLAPWAPEEGSSFVQSYFAELLEKIKP